MDQESVDKTRQAHSKLQSYSTIKFIQDLFNELESQPEALAKIFPERVYHFSDVDLSQFWKGNDKFIEGKKYYKQNQNPMYEIKENDLNILKEKSINTFGAKSIGLIEITRQYKSDEITMFEFIDKFKNELGRISGEVKVSKTELSFLFGMAHNYISTISKRLEDRDNPNFNPSFAFSKEVLGGLVDNLSVFKFSFRKVLDIIERFISLNPDLKEYSGQQYTITNPNFFSDILQSPTVAYWFGFLCADGYVSNVRNNYEIGVDLSIKDEDHLKKFGELVGFDESRILYRVRIQCYNSEIKVYKTNEVKFSCKSMYNALTELGLSELKSDRISVLPIIKEAIRLAKKEAENIDVPWSETSYGKVAHAWLLGFFDGDGRYNGRTNPRAGKYSAQIYSVSRDILEEIKNLFGIRNEVRVKVNPGDKMFVFDKLVISKGFYRLTLGPDVFKRLLQSYTNSLDRKRP